MDLLNVLLNTMTTDSSVNSLAAKTGASTDQVTSTVASAIPVLLQSMTKNASTEKGAASLLDALTQHTGEETIESQIQNADEKDGNAIIKHILGGESKTVVDSLSAQSGMNASQVTSLLGSIAPALLTCLSAATKSASRTSSGANGAVDLSSLIKLFGGSSSGLAGTLLSSMLGGGSSRNSGGLAGSLLGSLLGGGSSKKSQSSMAGSLLGSLLGGGTSSSQQQKQDTSSFDGSALLGALLSAMK